MENFVKLMPGLYIVAVSGGVDSVVLLDILSKQPGLDIVVAHFDHGIRHNSREDAVFVEKLAKEYGYPFELDSGELGEDASEETARNARYDFLQKVANKYNALGVVTAHHQDDVIETCFINILRGTGRKGMSSLKNRPGIYRPMLGIGKSDIVEYAKANNIKWHEDSTNTDIKYLRNKIRLTVIPKMSEKQRTQLLNIIKNTDAINVKIDDQLTGLLRRGLHKNQLVLNRAFFISLNHDISKEVIHTILTKLDCGDVDKKTIDRVVVFCKTWKPGKKIEFHGGQAHITKRSIRFYTKKK